jgi:aryl-alcohol dehydrogenase-like predicted oxidoreductase
MTGSHTKPLAGGARPFGTTQLTVSALGYGAMELSGPPRARDLAESQVIQFIHALSDHGINYIDTSIDYGLSESLIGKALVDRRSSYILASKCACQAGLAIGDHGESHIYTAQNVIAGVEQSLKRLRTDYLDVVQVHGNPTRRELEDGGVIDALQSLHTRGLVRYFGLSSRLPLLAEFVEVDSFSVFQVPYSALQRTNEAIIQTLKNKGKAIVARGVTGRGAPSKGWATRPIGTAQGEVQALWEKAGLDDLIEDMEPIEFMIRFALTNPDLSVALVATTNLAHLKANIASAAKGPLPPQLYNTVCARLNAAGGGPGEGVYKGGGPTPVL